jgi:Na+/H+ antiporter NhaC
MTSGEPTPTDDRTHESAVAIAQAKGEQPPELPAYAYHEYRLYTGDYLSAKVGSDLPAWTLPTLIFLLASVVAFATGTSWGTMGIVMPMAIPLAYSVVQAAKQTSGAEVDPGDAILLCTIGSVLAGAIFGDHCSPISDTTVLSSQASGCDHVVHVWTQLPYALLVGAVAVLFGTLPVGLGVSVWLLLPSGVVAMVIALLFLGRRVE